MHILGTVGGAISTPSTQETCLPLSWLVPISLAWQLAGATISGVVRDEVTGAPVVGTIVTMPALGRETMTDAFGRYRLSGVPSGPQHLAVRHLGYTSPQLDVFVPATGVLVINLVLRPAPLSIRTLEARAYIPVRGAEEDTSVHAAGITYAPAAVIRNNPMVAEPDVLASLAGPDVTVDAEAPTGLHVRGGSADQVAYLLDDVPIFNPYHSGALFSAWNPDAIGMVELHTPLSAIEAPHVLSGTVMVKTLDDMAPSNVQLALTTTQARATANGVLRGSGMRYLVSGRSELAGMRRMLPGTTSSSPFALDGLAAVRFSLLRGTLNLLHYENHNAVFASALAQTAEDTTAAERSPGFNEFRWSSRSTGAAWDYRSANGVRVRALIWEAATSAGSDWSALDSMPLHLTSDRRDRGGFAELQRVRGTTRSSLGVRVNSSRTRYESRSGRTDRGAYSLAGTASTFSVMLRDRRPLRSRLSSDVSLRATLAGGRTYWTPQALLSWHPAHRLTMEAGISRSIQFEQSLRNPEAVPSFIFPAELYVNHGSPGVPVARSTQVKALAAFRPRAGMRIALQGYQRTSASLVLAAPVSDAPFATSGFVVGAARASGAAADVAISRARFGVQASYGVQTVHLSFGDTAYTPGFASSHQLQAGVLLFPAATWSLRLATTTLVGRSTSPAAGRFDWQSCSGPTGGCSFAGSPKGRAGPLGSTPLPWYFRLDIGGRKHWHLRMRGRAASVGVFAAANNLFGTANAALISQDPLTGARELVQMHPRAPFAAGLDLQF